MENSLKKPKIALISRYPIDFEVIPFQGYREFINYLLKEYALVYYTMGWAKSKDESLRIGLSAKELPIKVDISNSFDKWFKTILYYLFLPFLLLKIRNEKPDLIIFRENMPLIPLFFRILGKPALIEIGDWWPSIILGASEKGKKIAKIIEDFDIGLWSKKKYKALIHNEAEKKIMLEKGLSENQLKIVYQPMFGKDKYFPCNASQERKNFGFAKKDFVVATHGIMHKSKGYDQVLCWWAELIKEHPNWKFLFIGGTMGEDWFRKLMSDLNINDKVIITGFISDQTKLNLYLNCADCLLVTRRNTPDNFGTTPSGIPHSLMTALPTVITGIPSVKEMIQDRKNAYIFEPDDYHSFKKCLEEIYNNPKKAKKIGLAGFKRAKEYFSPKKTAEQYIDLINTLLRN